MPSPTRLKKIKTKLKKQRANTKATSAANRQTQSRPSPQDSTVGKLNADPQKLTQTDPQNALQELNRDIEGAKDLPPAEASILLRAAYFLRQVLLNLDSSKKDSADKNEQEKKEAEVNPTDLKKAGDDFMRAKENVKNKAVAGEGLISTVAALKKSPKDMTADEISDAIGAVEKAIEEGKKELLPADASLLQRVLYALKMALLELGGVEPELAVKDKKKLEELITAQTGDAAPAPATQAKVTQAVDDVRRVQADIASRKPANQNKKNSEYPGLDVLTQKKPEDLSAQELADAIQEIDRSIKDSKVLLPENASTLQRALYALRMALFELGGVDPKLHYEIQEQLKTILKER